MARLIDWWQEFSWKQRILVVAMGLAILSVGWWLTVARASPEPVSVAIPPATTNSVSDKSERHSVRATASSGSQVSSHDTQVFVDVQGAVKHPGLYQFGPEMRVADAIKTAGGLNGHADRQQINLATRLTDQQQLYIPAKGEKVTEARATTATSSAQAAGSQSASQTTAVVNLNTATVADLQQLTGIGEKKAQKIVDFRTAHGAFKTVNDLTQVPGFGEKTVANLQDQLTT
ncbi:helix-hairpin-helix domain-containing protein [Levilactobacillus enshiensis]|uniref:helix-hairpin-helix domain-containing protein n=1 Tax=Levilactobacillus enshiensis TaxID=2590213 RepID=UPI00117BD99E|nr:helix-hairpin-helix domain-containing protein [Levilactobacillus enshiensis]